MLVILAGIVGWRRQPGVIFLPSEQTRRVKSQAPNPQIQSSNRMNMNKPGLQKTKLQILKLRSSSWINKSWLRKPKVKNPNLLCAAACVSRHRYSISRSTAAASGLAVSCLQRNGNYCFGWKSNFQHCNQHFYHIIFDFRLMNSAQRSAMISRCFT